MSAFELVVLAGLVTHAPVQEEFARGWAEVQLRRFKARDAELWEAMCQTMNPRHIGSAIADVVFYRLPH